MITSQWIWFIVSANNEYLRISITSHELNSRSTDRDEHGIPLRPRITQDIGSSTHEHRTLLWKVWRWAWIQYTLWYRIESMDIDMCDYRKQMFLQSSLLCGVLVPWIANSRTRTIMQVLTSFDRQQSRNCFWDSEYAVIFGVNLHKQITLPMVSDIFASFSPDNYSLYSDKSILPNFRMYGDQ